MKVQASVARCLRTPPSNRYSLKGFHFRCQHRLRGESNLSIVVIRNYKDGLMTVVPCRAKTHPLRPCRSYFAPSGSAQCERGGDGGGAGYCPRVQWVYYDGHLSP